MTAPVPLTLRVADRATRVVSPVCSGWFRQRPPRDSKHLVLIKRTIAAGSIIAHAEGIGLCLALTDQELLIGRARWFGSHVERYRLSRLLRWRRLANRDVDLLEVEFAGLPPTRVISFYDVSARAAFAVVIARLQRRLAPLRPLRRNVAKRMRGVRPAGAPRQRPYLHLV